MKAILRINLLFWAVLATVSLPAQNDHKYLLKGDQSYSDENFEQAELNYRRALEQQNSTQGIFNLGNTTYRQERYDEAIKHFEAAAESADGNAAKAKAFHNLGNAHFQAGQYKESVDAYKNALRLNPNDLATKQNLLRAIRNLPPPQQQQQPQNGEGQDDQEQQPQDQNQQQQESGEQEQDDKQQQNQPSKEPQEQSKDLSKEEAEKLLEIMDQEEQKVQEKLRKKGAKGRQKKDW